MEHIGSHNKLLVIAGPTATGKTNLALEIAREFQGEVISADSRQVYRGMDIGTGKDGKGVVHLYDVVNPDEEFSVAHFLRLAVPMIYKIQRKNALPIVVGGTGLYIKALVEGIDTVNIPRNESLRSRLANASVEELQQMVPKSVLEMMNNSDRNNPRRLIRKIEIMQENQNRHIEYRRQSFDTLQIGLIADEEYLSERIIQRVMDRVHKGIIEEIQQLLGMGYTWDLPAMNTIGYKEWKRYMESPSDEHKNEAIASWIRHEIQYAKRQLVWFKKQQNIQWFSVDHQGYKEDVKRIIHMWYTSS